MTDLERLHDVIEKTGEGYSLPPQIGKTFLRCHELAGQVEVGEVNCIVVGMSYMSDLDYLLPIIKKVFDEHGIIMQRLARNKFKGNNKTILFLSVDQMEIRTRGLEYFYQPMRHED